MKPCPVRSAEPSRLSDAYLRCAECGLLYCREIPSLESMQASYGGGGLKRLRRRFFAPVRRKWMFPRLGRQRERGRIWFSVVSRFAPEGEVTYLDIGCNRGFLVEAAMKAGWNAYGMEIAAEQIRPFVNSYPHMRERIGVAAFPDGAERLAGGTFDVVSAVDVIEHFADPEAAFAEVLRLLRKGGAFVVQTPDGGGDGFRERGPEWRALKPGEHLHIFNATNLERLAKRAGFVATEMQPEPVELCSGNLLAVLRK